MGSVMIVRKGNNHRDRRKKESNVALEKLDGLDFRKVGGDIM